MFSVLINFTFVWIDHVDDRYYNNSEMDTYFETTKTCLKGASNNLDQALLMKGNINEAFKELYRTQILLNNAYDKMSSLTIVASRKWPLTSVSRIRQSIFEIQEELILIEGVIIENNFKEINPDSIQRLEALSQRLLKLNKAMEGKRLSRQSLDQIIHQL